MSSPLFSGALIMRSAFILTTAVLLSGSLAMAPSAVAQPATAGGDPRAAMQAESRKAMSPFSWLVGEWEGAATVFMANGSTMALQQRETVTSAAFGTAMLIQGRGTMTVNGASRQTWDAAALFGYDVTTAKFLFTSASGSGQMQTFAVTPQGDGFTWGFRDAQGVEHKYVITRTPDGHWHEVGSTSADGGKTWTKTIELDLVKKP
ncbi:MAG: hypothetical protein IT354_14025 [Gemmatimonadaceae bacterium]|nr:hypothetical protein [Gemmatimonadaceae bacterium]